MKMFEDIQTALGVKKPDSNLPKDQVKQKKVLIVEDEVSLLQALKEALEEANMKVETAVNGQEGLDKLITVNPDVVVLDLMMPVMDGKKMLRNLRQIPEYKTLPVVVLTNAGEADNIRETVTYDDAVEFLIKSNVSLDQLVETVKRIY